MSDAARNYQRRARHHRPQHPPPAAVPQWEDLGPIEDAAWTEDRDASLPVRRNPRVPMAAAGRPRGDRASAARDNGGPAYETSESGRHASVVGNPVEDADHGGADHSMTADVVQLSEELVAEGELVEDAVSEGDSAPRELYMCARRAMLTKSPMEPLHTQKGETDGRLGEVLAALHDLPPGQTAAVQLLGRRNATFQVKAAELAAAVKDRRPTTKPRKWEWARYYWLKYIWNKDTAVKPTAKAGAPGSVAKERGADAGLKAQARHHFDAELRLLACGDAEESDRLDLVLEAVESAFEPFNQPLGQHLAWGVAEPLDVTGGIMPIKPAVPDRAPRRDEPGLLLSSVELGLIAPFPDSETATPVDVHVRRISFKKLLPPNPLFINDRQNPPPGAITLGLTRPDTAYERRVGMTAAQLTQHMVVNGATGTGKSELLKEALLTAAKSPERLPIVVVDPPGRLTQDLFRLFVEFCPERLDDLLYIDLTDDGWPLAFNPLDVNDHAGVETAVGTLVSILDKQLQIGSNAPRTVKLAEQVLRCLAEGNLRLPAGKKLTLLHVVDFLTDIEFRHSVVRHVEDVDTLRMFGPAMEWDKMTPSVQQGWRETLLGRLGSLGSSPLFANVFAASDNRYNLVELVKERRIILLNLGKGDPSKDALGSFVGGEALPTLHQNVLVYGINEDELTGENVGGDGVVICFDEAPSTLADSETLNETLAEDRKHGVRVIISYQFSDQFSSDTKAAIANNANTKIYFRLAPAEAKTAAESLASDDLTARDIMALENFYAYVRLPGEKPFAIKTQVPLDHVRGGITRAALAVRAERMRYVKDRTRERLCNRKEDMRARRARAQGSSFNDEPRRQMTVDAMVELNREALANIQAADEAREQFIATLPEEERARARARLAATDDLVLDADDFDFDGWRGAGA